MSFIRNFYYLPQMSTGLFPVGAICKRRLEFRAYSNWMQNRNRSVVSSIEGWKNDEGSNGGNGQKNRWMKITAGVTVASISVAAIRKYHEEIDQFLKSKIYVFAAKKKKQDATPAKPSLTSREFRFLSFASVEYEGQIFMTPRDFLDSVTQMQPIARKKRHDLTEDEVKEILKKTPPFNKGSKNTFRNLNETGLISYTEYLFLLCVLTKPTTGFRIAFNMFDTDGNQKVDKKEFLVLDTKMLDLVKDTSLHLRKECKEKLESGACHDHDYHHLETVFASSRRQKRELQLRQYEDAVGPDGVNGLEEDVAAIDPKPQEQSTDSRSGSAWSKTASIMDTMRVQDTTLLRHFFGKKGNMSLTFDDFHKFMDNLQTEVLEIEFMEFSRGKLTITETDFATILLRYTVARQDDYKAYMDRVRERIPDMKGITFDQFKQFCQFLTCLDDFTIAVKLYTFADLPVSQNEFARAVKVSTGHALDPHVVDTVFQIFDVNSDGRLSYSEFIAVMRDRLHRGFRTHLVQKEGWEAFKQCIRAEMKRY